MNNQSLQDKLIDKLYNFWKHNDTTRDNFLLKNITTIVKKDGIDGANILLDWCRDDYDKIREKYMKLHKINEDEMEKIMDSHSGTYEFMYEKLPEVSWLDEIWDLCNYYLDYCNSKTRTEKGEYADLMSYYL